MSNPSSTWTPQQAALPLAGWFTDPASASRLRWWDGAAWSEHTMDAPDAAPVAPTPPAWTPPATAAAAEPLRRERRRDRAEDAAPTIPPIPASPDFQAYDTPYVPFSGQYSAMAPHTRARTLGSPNTRGIWGLALLPLAVGLVEVGLYLSGLVSVVAPVNRAAQLNQALYSLGLSLGALLAVVLLVVADRSALKSRNVTPASGWWLLLFPPIAYFIARRVVLKRQGVISNAPGNVYVLCLFAPYALIFLVAFLVGMSQR